MRTCLGKQEVISLLENILGAKAVYEIDYYICLISFHIFVIFQQKVTCFHYVGIITAQD